MKKKGKFNSVFPPKNVNKELPTALKKMIDSKAPEGYEYRPLGNSTTQFTLRRKDVPDGMNFRVKFPCTFEGVKVNNMEELLELSYRTQIPIELDEKLQNGSNGEPATILSTLGTIEKPVVFPYKFPEIPPLKVYWGSELDYVPIHRVPHNSFDEFKVESESNSILNLLIIVNEEKNEMKYTINLNFDLLQTIDDYFKYRKYIKAYYEGKLKIFSERLHQPEEKKTIFENNDKLYTALKSLQVIFNKKIEFPRKISGENLKMTRILFENLVNNRAVRFPPESELSLTFDKDSNIEEVHSTLRRENINFFIPLFKEKTLFNISLDTNENQLYTHMKFKNFMEYEDGYKLILESTNKSEGYIYYQVDEGLGDKFPVDIEDAVDIKMIDFTVI
ncbi:abortive phage resistance protein AbiGII [Lactococcus garvieae]|uniref:abortive phage resistance protein AbiGII n=1 Tax=Lactococcus garvieae TaxID=1363 RepID=UPI003854D455